MLDLIIEKLSKSQREFFIVLLLVTVFSTPSYAGNRIALVIGNNAYEDILPLKYARPDAEAMAKALKDVGYDVVLETDLSRKKLLNAIRTFKKKVQGGDEVVFYYAGHGVTLEDGVNLLLPVDIGTEDQEAIKDDALPLNRVLSDLNEKRPLLSLIIIDACRNNPFKGNKGRGFSSRGLSRETIANGQMIIYSAGDGQQALDHLGNSDTSPNGLFTRVFLKEMKKPNISIRTVINNVREEVFHLAKGIGFNQTPSVYDQVIGDFYFTSSPEVITSQRATALKPLPRAPNVSNFSMIKLKKEQEVRLGWVAWQSKMKKIFDEVVNLKLDTDLKIKAWDDFLLRFETNNPRSNEDEYLRSEAENKRNNAISLKNKEQQTKKIFVNSTNIDIYPDEKVKLQDTLLDNYLLSKSNHGVQTNGKKTASSLPSTIQMVEKEKTSYQYIIKANNFTQSIKEEYEYNEHLKAVDKEISAYPVVKVNENLFIMASKQDLLSPVKLEKNQEDERNTIALKAIAKLIVLGNIEKEKHYTDEFISMASGSFMMGNKSGARNEKPAHTVTVEESFLIKKNLVTFEEYDVFCKDTKRKRPNDLGWGRKNRPVINVSLHDAMAYASWLSKKTGLNFRLPTESEWEFSAKYGGGSKDSYDKKPLELCKYGNGSGVHGSFFSKLRNCDDKYKNKTSPVGSFLPNNKGIYDMLGNVWEWTQSRYSFNFDGSETAKVSKIKGNELYSVRGGSWMTGSSYLHSGIRGGVSPTSKGKDLGFRLILVPENKTVTVMQ